MTSTKLRALAAGSLLAAACSGPGSHAPPRDLRGSLEPLRAWFDANASKPRALLLLSPT